MDGNGDVGKISHTPVYPSTIHFHYQKIRGMYNLYTREKWT